MASHLFEQHPAAAGALSPREDVAAKSIVRERFPRIADMIEQLWGSRDLDDYLARLVICDRDSRAGFPPPVLEALLSISRLHAMAFQFWDDMPGVDPFQQFAFRR